MMRFLNGFFSFDDGKKEREREREEEGRGWQNGRERERERERENGTIFTGRLKNRGKN